jgi:hypothetical protein
VQNAYDERTSFFQPAFLVGLKKEKFKTSQFSELDFQISSFLISLPLKLILQ